MNELANFPLLLKIISGLLSIANVLLGWGILEYIRRKKRIETVEDTQKLHDQKMNVMLAGYDGINNRLDNIVSIQEAQNETLTEHGKTLADLSSLIPSNHNEITRQNKLTMMRHSEVAWTDGLEFIKSLIEKNHEKYFNKPKEYQDLVYQELKTRIIDTNKKIAEMADPIKMETDKARNITNRIFIPFQSEINNWIGEELAHQKKLSFGWSTKLRMCVATYMIQWKAIYEYIYE